MTLTPQNCLQNWFLEKKRSFPWRENPTPYAVWISEVMLQQTRASVVVDYFLRWMKQFPTLSSVADAPLENLIKAWEGLGYYSRVRNIKKGALFLASQGGFDDVYNLSGGIHMYSQLVDNSIRQY